MPLANIGSLVVSNIVFLVHLVYFHLAFTHADPALIVVLYLISKLVARRPDDLDPPPQWPPSAAAPKW